MSISDQYPREAREGDLLQYPGASLKLYVLYARAPRFSNRRALAANLSDRIKIIPPNETEISRSDTTPIIFTLNSVGHVHTWWEGELRTFQDEAAARAFASKQGLHATFAAVDDQHDGSEI